uniref:PPPDE domain-containing protein n=1 Tax=Globodera rostochiensis TaxID=31243 RepID=A0A914HMS4_GLORO
MGSSVVRSGHQQSKQKQFVSTAIHYENVSEVLWSLNGTELFGISFAFNDDGQTLVDVTNESTDDSLEGKQQWHTKDGAVALTFTAKCGRLRFEVETGGKMRKSWFVLRINEVNVREDSGEWRCRVLVVDGNGGVRVEAESRKSIGGDQWEQSAEMRAQLMSNGRQMWKREHHQQRNWRRGSSTSGGGDVSSLFSFSFTKTDTDFVVFERTVTPDSAAVHGGTRLSQSLDRGEGIAYSRVDSVHQSDKVNNLDDIWLMRWNSALRRRSNRNKYNELFCENLGEKQCREKEKETIARLTVRELFNMAKIINVKLYIWWYRFRYHVDSAVKFEQIGSETEIRLGIVQYYNQICKEFNEIKTNWKSEKLTNFNPVAELPQDKSKALMSKPTGAGMPVYVYSERFPSRLKIGAACQAMDIEHRFVKVYDIEFHFGMNEGVIISDKIRKRTDPERGVKINFIGWTKESQWEVQKIYDQFNDFYLEDGVFKEGKFSITKYHLSANNCIHFSNAFVEALLKNNDQIKKKPPSVLKQPLINGNSCQFVANCFMPPTTSDSDD